MDDGIHATPLVNSLAYEAVSASAGLDANDTHENAVAAQ